MKVKEFMTTKLELVDGERSVYDAVEKMVDRRIRSVVVKYPGKEGQYGVITARDVVFKVFAKGMNPRTVKASEIASKPLVCIDQETSFDEAVELMESSGVARLFVCDHDGIVGVVALLDVMAASLIMRAGGDHVPR
jgi:signal-transduction protein with cAMP-binding, CBS, and nucleotidyltransferase domain